METLTEADHMRESRPLIGVFELGLVPAALADRFPDYAQMIIDWLKPSLPDAEYRPVRIIRGEPLPAPDAFDGVLYSGSRHGVHDDLDWIGALKTFVRDTAALERPQFGICFGHQLMAEALGGRAGPGAAGWGCGAHEYRLTGAIAGRETLRMLVMHQDQVLEAPPNSNVIGGSTFCPNGVIDYTATARSVQFHPEFDPAFVAGLLTIYGGEVIPPAVAKHAAASLRAALDDRRVADWTAAFFRAAIEQPAVT